MALTYDKVITVISQPPDLRKDFEVNNLLPWFRKKSDLFRNLKTELLFDIIKNLQFVTKTRDDIIIKQGEQGDCMYILLRGKITIYILYVNKPEGEEGNAQPVQVNKTSNESVRQQLGTFVCSLGPGATFGEVALMSEDCIRTASIIIDETTDLIVVDRDLYNRSVKNVLKKEFEEKSSFVSTSPYLYNWAPKYKKQITMALQKETFPYEGLLCRQGDPVGAIYFILSGEVKVIMDPVQHRTQYPKLCLPEEPHDSIDTDADGVDELLRSAVCQTSSPRFRKKAVKKQPQEVCLLSVNESVGDIEILSDMDTYMQTAICTQRTEVLVLELKHYERLLVKRNPRTIDNMKTGLEIRIKTRISKHLERSLPLLKVLMCKAEEYNHQRQQQNEARNLSDKQDRQPQKAKPVTFDSFIPPRGPLIDQHGPGTVFYRIKQQEQAKLARSNKKMFGGGGGGHGLGRAATHASHTAPIRGANTANGHPAVGHRQLTDIDYQTSDPVLTNLEERMRAWLSNDNTKTGRGQPRVAKMQRSKTEVAEVKPGARVIVRSVRHDNATADDLGNEEEMTFTGSAYI